MYRRIAHAYKKGLFSGIPCRPSSGLEPETLLTMRSDWQLVATHGNGFRLCSDCQGCHRLRPLGSIDALYLTVRTPVRGRPASPRRGHSDLFASARRPYNEEAAIAE
jgi:hypothetical protein